MSAPEYNELTPVRNSVERFFFAWFFVIIPAVYTLRLILEYAESGVPYALLDYPKIVAELALLIFLTLANMFFATVNPTIASLFSNGVVFKHKGEDGKALKTQATCEQKIDRLLNHHARVLIGALAAFVTYYYVTIMGGLNILARAGSLLNGSLLNVLDTMLYFLPTVCYTYFVGIVIWKLFVTSLFFQSLPERYALVPRFLHPYNACGFLPFGNLCLRMMYVAVIPTMLSGLFLLSYFVVPQEMVSTPPRIEHCCSALRR